MLELLGKLMEGNGKVMGTDYELFKR